MRTNKLNKYSTLKIPQLSHIWLRHTCSWRKW